MVLVIISCLQYYDNKIVASVSIIVTHNITISQYCNISQPYMYLTLKAGGRRESTQAHSPLTLPITDLNSCMWLII